jgi:hypothetical protein
MPRIIERYDMELKLFQGYLKWGIARSLKILLYEQHALNASKLNWGFVSL